jgi:hypothetical protein
MYRVASTRTHLTQHESMRRGSRDSDGTCGSHDTRHVAQPARLSTRATYMSIMSRASPRAQPPRLEILSTDVKPRFPKADERPRKSYMPLQVYTTSGVYGFRKNHPPSFHARSFDGSAFFSAACSWTRIQVQVPRCRSDTGLGRPRWGRRACEVRSHLRSVGARPIARPDSFASRAHAQAARTIKQQRPTILWAALPSTCQSWISSSAAPSRLGRRAYCAGNCRVAHLCSPARPQAHHPRAALAIARRQPGADRTLLQADQRGGPPIFSVKFRRLIRLRRCTQSIPSPWLRGRAGRVASDEPAFWTPGEEHRRRAASCKRQGSRAQAGCRRCVGPQGGFSGIVLVLGASGDPSPSIP